MEKVTGHILKSGEVNLEGQFRLDVPQLATAKQKAGNISSGAAEVHIVETQPQFAVIEIICSCGTKTYLRCEYGEGKSAQSPETQDDTHSNSEQPTDQTK